MRILVTGGGGMLARELARTWTDQEVRLVPRAALDLADFTAVEGAVREARADVVVNCAAMTAVDACESHPDEAFRVNAIGAGNLATACQRSGTRLAHISTDYVFPGDLDRAYHEWDAAGPRNVYGASKLAGEIAVRTHCPDHLIVRVAWLYGPGGPSFVHRMLDLGLQSGPPLPVVDDQVGNPTSASAVAEHLGALLGRGITGTVHLTCAGETSWHGLANEIFRIAGLGRPLRPCSSLEHPRPASRPRNSRLEKRALALHGLPAMPDWIDSLERFLKEHPRG